MLGGTMVRLEPLSTDHVPDLAEAAEEDRSAYHFTVVPRADEVADYVAMQLRRKADGEMAPLAQVRRSDGRAVGCTTFCNPRRWTTRDTLCAVEIGWTWLAASAQGTGLNREAKLLLLGHAFETWRVARVDLKTDARNARSRQAIAGLGATFEGVLRSWSPSRAPGEAGLLRDSAMFSVVAREWPSTKAALAARVRRDGEAAGERR